VGAIDVGYEFDRLSKFNYPNFALIRGQIIKDEKKR